MKLSLTALLVLSTILFVHAQWKRAGTTRYWDCSKPHCAWKNIPPNTHSSELPFRHEYAFKRCNNCPMGAKYFGTAAASTGIMGGDQNSLACGKCYALRAVGSTTVSLILQANNLCPGSSNPSCTRDHFDIAVPGFDWNAASVSNTCRQTDPQVLYNGNEQPCMRSPVKSCNCDRVSSDPVLVEGCKLFVELGWDNQEVEYQQVACPGSSNLGSGGSSPSQPSRSPSQPSRPPSQPSTPSRGNCGGISATGDTNNQWWVEFVGPDGRAQLECTGSSYQVTDCTKQWGKWTCPIRGKPCLVDSVAARYAIVNGQKCRLNRGSSASSDEDTYFTESFPIDSSLTDDPKIDEISADQMISDAVEDGYLTESNAEEFSVDTAIGESNEFGFSGDQMFNDEVESNFESNNDFSTEQYFENAAVDAQDQTSQVNEVGSSVPAWGFAALTVFSALLVVLVVLVVLLARVPKH
jgi:hypothetical protein